MHPFALPSDVESPPCDEEAVGQKPLLCDLLIGLAAAEELGTGMRFVLERVRSGAGAAAAEWWSADPEGAPGAVVSVGTARGRRQRIQLGPAGLVVIHGGRREPQIEAVLRSLAPVMRRRASEERLAQAATQLALRNEALEEFAALVAHELKAPLHAALVADDPTGQVEEALRLVDTLLEAAHARPAEDAHSSIAEQLESVRESLPVEVQISTALATSLPLPAVALETILRNLLANAVAAGARHVHVAAVRSELSLQLSVDDDGAGLTDVDRYTAGSGLGLSLSRRIAARYGAVLNLTSRARGGARATLAFTEPSP